MQQSQSQFDDDFFSISLGNESKISMEGKNESQIRKSGNEVFLQQTKSEIKSTKKVNNNDNNDNNDC